LAELPQRWQLIVACGLLGGSSVLADDNEQEMPDSEFLEYLGSWAESDEDWLIMGAAEKLSAEQAKDKRTDPVPEGEESTEPDDER